MVQEAGAKMIAVLHVMEATEGGTRRHLRDLVSALDRQVFRVALAVSCERDPAFRTCDVPAYRANGIPVYEVPMRRRIDPLADAAAFVKLVGVVRRVRPQVIHAHSSKAGFLARLAGVLCRVPVVYTPHGFSFLMACGERSRRFYRFLEWVARRATAAVIAVSEEEVREALGLGYARDRVFLIRNGVAPRDFGAVTVREKGPLSVGFFGRLTRQKGPDVLLEAVPDIVAHLPQVGFCFYGVGEMADGLQAQADARQLTAFVKFKGACLQDETVARMRETDVVVVPSRWEGGPYVVLEAFQAGVPLVASAVGGIPDLVKNGENGLLVAADDSEALGDALLRLLREPLTRRRLAEQGREALGLYAVGNMAAAIGEVYQRFSR